MMIAPHREHTPPSMVADGGERPWSELQLAIKQHSVHKVEVDEATGDKLYVVSNLRKFTVEVQLLDKVTQELATSNQLRLRAVLLYENGCPVKAMEGQDLLLGETEVVAIQGVATFKLQMGQSVLSSKLGKQSFRIRLEPMDRQLRESYGPQLIILSEPLKSVTKLERRPPAVNEVPPGPYGGMGGMGGTVPLLPPAPAAGVAPPVHAPTIPIQPPNAARQTSPPPIPGQNGRFAAPGSCLFPPSPPRDDAPSNGFDGGAGLGGVDTPGLQDVVRQQRAQIAELTQSNSLILQELTRLRQRLDSDSTPAGAPQPLRHVAARSDGA